MQKAKIKILFSSIINGYKTNKKIIKVKSTIFLFSLLKFLYKEGYIFGFYSKYPTSPFIFIELKYNINGFSFIYFFKNFTTNISKQNIYISSKYLKKHFTESNRYVLSTSKGIINGYTAVTYNLGGVLLFKIN